MLLHAKDMALHENLPTPVTSLRSVPRLPLLVFFLLPLLMLGWVWAQDQPFVTQIDVVGARKVDESTVRFKLKSRVGDPYSPEIVREDVKALYSLGYFEDIVVQADIFEGGLKLSFVLYEKPSIQSIKIVGAKKIAVEKLKGKIDLVEGAIVPPGALLKNADKIHLFYEEEGYYQARVEGREERISPQEVAVIFDIVEGNQFDIGEIRIVGNKYLKEKDITAKMQTSPVWLWFFGGTLKREELRRDLDRIRAYYLDNGFLDIAVDEPEITINEAKKELRIVIRVEEGPQYRIGNLTVKGNSLFAEAEIRRLIRTQSGGIFSRETLQGDVVAITDRYAERGYLFADVAPITDTRRTENIVDVSLEITEGRQAFINRIEIVGNTRTREKVIRREIFLIEGDVFNSVLLQASRRNVEALGYFEEVKLDTKRSTAEDRVDVVVDVKEKPTGAFSIGGGFSSVDGLIGMVSISQSNLFGYGKRALVSGQIGSQANRFNLVYTDPHFLDSNTMMETRGYMTNTSYENNQGFNTETIGGAFSFGHSLFERVYGLATYTIEDVLIKDVDANAPFLVKEQAEQNGGWSMTSSVTGSLLRDARDSPTEPTRGNRSRLSATYAGGFLGADNNFTKFAVESSQYWPLWWSMVFNLRGTFWYGDSFGDTPQLPVQERYFLGGPNTIRGFRNFTVSPTDPAGGDGLTGGNKAWFVNTELIRPLYEPMRLRGLVFFDIGNNLDERSSLTDLVTTNARYSAGVGIRFNSPMGAMRLEWGFNLNQRENEKLQVLHFSAGTSF
jgi:outer membrane protein insertion porin family